MLAKAIIFGFCCWFKYGTIKKLIYSISINADYQSVNSETKSWLWKTDEYWFEYEDLAEQPVI